MYDQAPRVSIVIPCRNESGRLPSTLEQLKGYLAGVDFTWEVVVVIEPSRDNTVEIAQAYASKDSRFRVIANPVGRGKGFAVKTGMLAAEGENIFFMDADLSVPPRYIEEFLPVMQAGADVAFGSRRHRRSILPQRQPILREVFGRIFNWGLRILGATRFKDTQCGFKAFGRDAAQGVFSRLTLDGFGFDVEALALATVLGYRVVECPVEWSDAPGSSVRPLRDGITSFYEAVLAARRARRENRRPSC